MALEQLSLTPGPVDGDRDAVPNSNGGADDRLQPVEGGDEGTKAPRLPRWTRQEILVLIQGKRVAENRVRRGRTAGLAFGSPQAEPKWASVSSYCKRHGVNRGPVQCRKRWSNLAGDFKKIKEWESQIKEDSESFWVMRNDLRRERKLPGFFDKEVYDILNGASVSSATPGLTLALAPAAETTQAATEGEAVADEVDAETEVEAGAEAHEAVFDSGRSAAADDGLFSDFEQSGGQTQEETMEKEIPTTVFPAPIPLSEKQYQPFNSGGMPSQGTNEKHPPLNAEIGSTSQGQKRKRFATEGDSDTASLQNQLIDVLERNGRILSAQLEAQNIGLKLDREERKDHANSLVAVLSKLADALGRIADKL
ncbi:hypothetical protein Ancab_018187 [Ancistrocladus abbreviatus]